MKLEDFNEKEFLSGKGLPKGDTVVYFDTLEIEPTTTEFDGKTQKKFLLKINKETEYLVPRIVMADLKAVQIAGFEKARITRTGEKLETRYTVIGLK